MDLQTNIPLKAENNQIDYQSKLLLIGSCFVENIGQKLNYFKFNSIYNPSGIIFNPYSIAKFVSRVVTGHVYQDSDLFYHEDRWHCFDAHSILSAINKEQLLSNLNESLKITKDRTLGATHIFITLGTAWVYRHLKSDQVVANCHKVPQKEFLKELLSIETVFNNLKDLVSTINSVNRNATIVFTVSPVRHLKDGFIENQQSKSHLISAIHKLLSEYDNSERLKYFPSYEIMMDELRDYRFYAEDMLHPNDLAINYIWKKFDQVWISEHAQYLMNEIDAIQKGLAHKPFNPKSKSHISFQKKLELKIKNVQQKFPNIQF